MATARTNLGVADAVDRTSVTTLGTSEASKAVTADASNNVTLGGTLDVNGVLTVDVGVRGNTTTNANASGNISVEADDGLIQYFLQGGNTTYTLDQLEIGQGFLLIAYPGTSYTVSFATNIAGTSISYLTSAGGNAAAGGAQPNWLVSSASNHFEIYRFSSTIYVNHIGAT